MDKDFKEQIRKNVEVYVDDMVVKSLSPDQHAHNLDEIFVELKKHNMRLNPKKCTFKVGGGKFLGFMLNYRWTEENPDKCEVVIAMRSPKNVNEVEKMTGKILSLSRFLPKMAKAARSIFKLLKKS